MVGTNNLLTSDTANVVVQWIHWTDLFQSRAPEGPSPQLEQRRIALPLDDVLRFVQSRDGQEVLFAGHLGLRNRGLRLSPDMDSELGSIQGETLLLLNVAVSPVSDLVTLTAPEFGSVWDLRRGRELSRFRPQEKLHLEGEIVARSVPSFSPDGRLLLVMSSEGAVMRSTVNGKPIYRLADNDRIVAALFSPDSRFLLTEESQTDLRGAGQLTVWDVTSGKRIDRFDEPIGSATVMAFSPDGREIAFGGFSLMWAMTLNAIVSSAQGPPEVKLRIWDPSAATVRRFGRPQAEGDGQTGGVSAVTYSGDGHLLAKGGREGSVEIWSVANEVLEHRYDLDSGTIWSLEFEPHATQLLVGSQKGVHILDYS